MKMFSIHTIELCSRLSFAEYANIFPAISKNGVSRSAKYSSSETYEFPYGKAGITKFIVIKVYSDNNLKRHVGYCVYLHIIINTSLMEFNERSSRAKLVCPHEIGSALYTSFSHLADLLSIQIFDKLYLARVDFTGDLQFETQNQADEYLYLVKKGRAIRCQKEYETFDRATGKARPYNDSWYLTCKSYAFQVYPKYHQMMNRKMIGAENAIGIIRFEMRTNRQKLNLLKKTFHISHDHEDLISEIEQLAVTIPQEAIMRHMIASVGGGDFYTLAELKKRVQESCFQERVKAKMIHISESLSRCSNIQELLQKENLSSSEWGVLLRRFDMIMCSPISIPARFQYQKQPGVYSWDSCF